jgi:hypothetical protein
MDSRCGRIDRHGFNVTSQEFGEPRFKLAAPVSGRQPPELKHGNSGFDLAVADRWLKKRNSHAQPLSRAELGQIVVQVSLRDQRVSVGESVNLEVRLRLSICGRLPMLAGFKAFLLLPPFVDCIIIATNPPRCGMRPCREDGRRLLGPAEPRCGKSFGPRRRRFPTSARCSRARSWADGRGTRWAVGDERRSAGARSG